jgi:thiol:disulfide interchange protein DsbD
MRANMLARPEIAAVLKNFILVELYTDGTDAASQANSKLQLEKFNTVAEPYYVILDANEKLVAKFEGLTRDSAQFLAFLNQAQAPPDAAGGYPQATLLEGGPLSTASLAGKVVVVNFWATYCIPCIGEFPFFNKLYHQFSSQGVAFIGIAVEDDAAAKVPAFLKKHPIDYTVVLGSDALMQQYKLDALPVTLVYNQAGKQVKRFDGSITEPELLAAIQQAK